MKIVVTGGGSFIGSHLVERLVTQGHEEVIVLDNLSSGSLSNLRYLLSIDPNEDFHHGYFKSDIDGFWKVDLRIITPDWLATQYLQDIDLVYHLAADHGGRGYVETRQVNTSNNFAIDNNVFQACFLAGVPKIIYASSGCVYPPLNHPLSEYHVKQPYTDTTGLHFAGYNPDGLYGLAKLAGELTLQRMWEEHGTESVSCRFFTVYGPRAKENHAIMSFIARAYARVDPFVVWGDGTQVRNWTYVDDIVDGLVAAQSMSGCDAINLGASEGVTVSFAVSQVLRIVRSRYADYYAPIIRFDKSKPTGPHTRVADSTRSQQLLGLKYTGFDQGLDRTVEWYFSQEHPDLAVNLERLLVERK